MRKKKPTLFPGYIRCTVEVLRYGPIQVRFPDHPGVELFFQSDYDQAAFACSCGLIKSDSPLSQEFIDAELSDIWQCSDEYLSVTQPITTLD